MRYGRIATILALGPLLSGFALAAGGGTSSATTTSTANDVRVATFNLNGVNTDSKASGEHRTWRERRPGVVDHILSKSIDVVGLQEANQSTIYKANLDYGDNQYLDLVGALKARSAHYALTNAYMYNCVRSASSKNCVYQDREASNDNRIIYDTDRVRLVKQGSVKYAAQTAGKNARYFVWAVLEMKATGHRYFFSTTHLDPYQVSTRKAQWSQLISLTNKLKGSLPVVSTGDFNTSKFTDYAASYLPAMKNNGYGDAAGQRYWTTRVDQRRAETVRNAYVGSFNGWRRNLSEYSYTDDRTKFGNGIDWIFASNQLRVKSWAVTVTMNTRNQTLKGVIPSDHNMVRATVVVP